MNAFIKLVIWLCGLIFIIAFFNSLISTRKSELFRNFLNKIQKPGQYRPKHINSNPFKEFFQKIDLARFGFGLPRTKEGIVILFFLLVSVLILTFLILNFL